MWCVWCVCVCVCVCACVYMYACKCVCMHAAMVLLMMKSHSVSITPFSTTQTDMFKLNKHAECCKQLTNVDGIKLKPFDMHQSL